MKTKTQKQSRRDFILKAGTGALAVTSLSSFRPFAETSRVVPANTMEKYSFHIGIAGYTFLKIDLDKSLEMMKRVGVKYLSIKNFHLPFDSTAEQIKDFHNKLAAHDVTGYCVGPIYMHSEEEIDKAFDYTKRVGVNMMIGVPDYELLPYTEKKVKEYNIRVAIHNHGPDNLLYPTASFIVEKVGKMDERIGICLDIGHNKRAGEDPAMAVKKYSQRIFDMHIKDVSAAAKEGKNIELGRGVIDIPGFFRTLSKTKYNGVCSLEYEKDNTDPLPGISESIGYLNGTLDCIA